MENRSVEAPGPGRRELDAPFDREAVLSQRLVLGLELGRLRRVGGQAEAAGPSEGITGQLLDPVQVALGQHPERTRLLGTQLPPRVVVGRSATAQGEAAVAPARSAGDLPGLEHAHPLASL